MCSWRMEGKMDEGAEVTEEKEKDVEHRGERRHFAKRTFHGAFLLRLSVSCYQIGGVLETQNQFPDEPPPGQPKPFIPLICER